MGKETMALHLHSALLLLLVEVVQEVIPPPFRLEMEGMVALVAVAAQGLVPMPELVAPETRPL